MKIAIVCFSPSGGLMHYSVDLANSLAHVEGTDVYLLTRENRLINSYINERVKLLSFKGEKLEFTKFVISSLREINPLVVHFTQVYPTLPLILFYTKRSHILTVVTIHDALPHPTDIKSPLLLLKRKFITAPLLYNLVFKLADSIITLSSYVAGQTLLRYRYKTSIIRLTQDVKKFEKISNFCFRGEDGAISSASDKTTTFLFFGYVDKYKGIDVLMDAAKKLVQDGFTNFRIRICGLWIGKLPGLPRELQDFILVENRLIPDEEVCSIFTSADVVVLPYREVSQSGVLPLAFGFGKPVITPRLGSFPEWVIPYYNGLMFESENSQELAYRMRETLSRDLLIRLSKGAAETYKLYSWSRLSAEYINLYRALLNGDRKNLS